MIFVMTLSYETRLSDKLGLSLLKPERKNKGHKSHARICKMLY